MTPTTTGGGLDYGGLDYGYVEPLVPGVVDPVRSAVLAEGIDEGGWVWDPVEEARFGPEPGVDVAALFAAVDAMPDTANPVGVGDAVDAGDAGLAADVAADMEVAGDVVEPAVLVPVRMPSVEEMGPGVELAGVLDGAELPAVGAFELVEAIAGWQRMASWVAARQAAAISELSRRAEMRPTESGRVIESMSPARVTGLEVAARLGLTGPDGDRVTARALFLVEVLAGTLAALEAGRIDVRKAEVIADVLGPHDPDLARQVEAAVLGRAESLTAPRLRRLLVRTLHRLAPETMARRAESAADNRFVRTSPARDGMAWVEAYLPATDAAALETAVEAAAAGMKRTDPDDGRTHAQRRADALAQLGWLALASGRLGGCGCGQRLAAGHGRRVAVQVTVPISMLLGLDDSPAELAGHGPIPADVARRLAAHGTWRRLLTDPVSGALLDYGRTRYQPPPDLVEHVHARDGTCRWPGCERPAAGCHLDHTIPYPHGPTAASNLGPFCENNHLGKHHTRWKVHQPEPGRFEFISPTGHTYTIEPEPLGPILDNSDENSGGETASPTDPDPPGHADSLPAADFPPFDIPPF